MKRIAENNQKRQFAPVRRRDSGHLHPSDERRNNKSNGHFPQPERRMVVGKAGQGSQSDACFEGRGGGRNFGPWRISQTYTRCIFRLRQFLKSERWYNHKVSNVHWWLLSPKWSLFLCKWVLPLLWLLFWLCLAAQIVTVAMVRSISAEKFAYRSEHVFVAGVGVDGGGEDGLVSGEALGDANVFGIPVQIGAGGMPQRVKAQSSVKSGPFLPDRERVADLSGREPIAVSADEDGGIGFNILSQPLFPSVEFLQFVAGGLRQNDFLTARIAAASFEYHQLNSPFHPTILMKDIADVQGDNFVFPQPRPQRQTVNDVVPKPCVMFTADLQQQLLFLFGQGFGWLSDGVCVIHRHASFAQLATLTYMRGNTLIASQIVEQTADCRLQSVGSSAYLSRLKTQDSGLPPSEVSA